MANVSNADLAAIITRMETRQFIGSLVMRLNAINKVELNYDPNQPRDPKGSPTGGQWTTQGGISAEEMRGTARFQFRRQKDGKVIVSTSGATSIGSAEGLIIDSPFPQAPYDIPDEIKVYIENRVRTELLPEMNKLHDLNDMNLPDDDSRIPQQARVIKQIRENIRRDVEVMANQNAG